MNAGSCGFEGSALCVCTERNRSFYLVVVGIGYREGLAVEDVISFNPFSEVDRDEIKQLWTTVRGPDT